MILEGIVTTRRADGGVNVAPMGPAIDPASPIWPETIELKPFRTSETFANLTANREGVFHVTDDVLLLAAAAIGRADPPLEEGTAVSCPRLADCCRFHEFRIEQIDDRRDRAVMTARIVHSGTVREYFGLNRAKHAVVELAILATRIHLVKPEELREEIRRLEPLIRKTGSSAESQAWELLVEYIRKSAPPAGD